ncbi:MAG TPA: hypothetical protein VJ806_13630 [Luteimonas sp.]|nr:hypothetical protein [Luteimonas sp.]
MDRIERWILAAALCAVCGSAAAAERVRIVDEGGLRDRWTAAPGANFAAPGYPGSQAARGDNVCVAMGYAVRPDGSTSDFTLLKAWSSASGGGEPESGYWDAFSQAAASALSEWRFQPRAGAVSETTYTVATLHFMGRQGVEPQELAGHCAISDLADFIQRQKADRFFAGLDKHEMERLKRLQDRHQQAVAAAAAVRQMQQLNPPPAPPPPTP